MTNGRISSRFSESLRSQASKLSRAAKRTGVLPAFLDPALHLPHLARAVETYPRERHLHRLLLPTMGADPRPAGRRPPGDFWETSNRLGSDDDYFYDLESGMPLEVTLRASGIELVYVPSVERIHHS